MNWKVAVCSIALFLASHAWAGVPDPDPGSDSELGQEMQTLVKSYVAQHPGVSIDDAIARLAR